MKFNKQLFRHDPDEGVYGDCHRTAIACVLDLEPSEVPHFFGDPEKNTETCFADIESWLNNRGIASISVIYEGNRLSDVLSTIGASNSRRPDLLYLLGGISRNGTGHTVVCRDGEIVWDPSLNDSGIVGPMSDGFYWVTFFGSMNAVSAERLAA